MTHLHSVGYACTLALLLVASDFVSGIIASQQLGIPIHSYKLRRSISKSIIYCTFLLLTLVIGFAIHRIDSRISALPLALSCIKYQTYLIVWIELVSNLENLCKIFPKSLFLKQIHHVLSTEFLKRFHKS